MAVERDPVTTNPELYRVVMENDRVRVLEYRDRPGDRTAPHGHPDSVMITLSSFRRRLIQGDRSVEVELAEGTVRWLDAQEHAGENVGETESRAIFVELKEARTTGDPGADAPLGPSDGR
ncbi:MAG TPA: hypothetical protein VEW95_09705 [Candidatus Limnocylindrales bacterium]|nr:hypothetical protein [Candidatus Limnocylindrales bacterium]